MPDLKIQDVTARRERRVLEATVHNAGTGSAGPTMLRLYGPKDELLAQAEVPALSPDEPNDTTVVSIGPVDLPTQGTLRVDDPDNVDEADETNNQYHYP